MSVQKRLILISLIMFSSCFIQAQEIIDVLITGVSDGIRSTLQNDRDKAIIDAKLQAVQRAGVNIQSVTEVENFMLKRDWIQTTAEAFLLPGYNIIETGYGEDGLYRVVLSGRLRIAPAVAPVQPAAPVPVQPPVLAPGTMRGNDGKVYKTVRIGNQIWMAENLMETRYRNGDAIPEVRDSDQWARVTTGARCSYDNNAGNADIYGYLYNWHAVNDRRNIAPPGWRVPSDDDWKELERALGMSRSVADETGWRGSPVGSRLAGGASLWGSGALKNHAVFGTSGFSALPAGYRHDANGRFYNNSYAHFWSATVFGANHAWDRYLYFNDSGVYRYDYNKRTGFSVRLVRD